jgi:hypothetical protein
MKFLMHTCIDDMITAPRQENELQRAFHKLTKSITDYTKEKNNAKPQTISKS